MLISSWNVNSVRARIENIKSYLLKYKPDILMMQEIKTEDVNFPYDDFSSMDYESHVFGQKSYNGVAIIARQPLAKIDHMEWTGKSDCRHIWAMTHDGVGIHNFYVPAGGDVPDIEANPKFAHKLQFIDEMTSHFSANQPKAEILVGDLNIAPLASDVWSSKQLLKIISHTPVETDGLKRLIADGGWHDAVRAYFGDDQKLYSWWSYRARDWAASDRGRRLDHIWVSHDLADKVVHAEIHRDWRGVDKPSDHVPVSLTI